MAGCTTEMNAAVLLFCLLTTALFYQFANAIMHRRRACLHHSRLRMSLLQASSLRIQSLCQKSTRRLWIRPGRTHVWWDNFMRDLVIPEECHLLLTDSQSIFSAAFSTLYSNVTLRRSSDSYVQCNRLNEVAQYKNACIGLRSTQCCSIY